MRGFKEGSRLNLRMPSGPLLMNRNRITNRLKESRDSYLQARIEDVLEAAHSVRDAISNTDLN